MSRSLKPCVTSCSFVSGVEPISYRHHSRDKGATRSWSSTTFVARANSITVARVLPSSSSIMAAEPSVSSCARRQPVRGGSSAAAGTVPLQEKEG